MVKKWVFYAIGFVCGVILCIVSFQHVGPAHPYWLLGALSGGTCAGLCMGSALTGVERTMKPIAKFDSELFAPRANRGTCAYCGGNDGNVPCAYPSVGKLGCLRDIRLAVDKRSPP